MMPSIDIIEILEKIIDDNKLISRIKSHIDWTVFTTDTIKFQTNSATNADRQDVLLSELLSKKNIITLSKVIISSNGYNIQESLDAALNKILDDYEFSDIQGNTFKRGFIEAVIFHLRADYP